MNRRPNHAHRFVLVLAALTACLGETWLLGSRDATVRDPAPVPIEQITSGAIPEMPPQGRSPIRAIKGWITSEPAGSYDFQDLLVEIDGKRVKAECEIDGQGRFMIDNLPPGQYGVYVREAMSLYQILCPGVQVRIDATQPGHEVALQVGKSATVTVHTHPPVSGLSIRVQSAIGPDETASTTDVEGRCEFELAPGRYLLETSVFKNGQSIPIGPEPFIVAGQDRPLQLTLSIPVPLSKAVDIPDFLYVDSKGSSSILGSVGILSRLYQTYSPRETVHEQRATITGSVVDPNGEPIPDAHLYLETPLPDGSIPGRVQSFYEPSLDDDGGFVFTDVQIGLPVKVVAVAMGRIQGRSQILKLKPGTTTDVGDIVLSARRPQDGVITGRIIDEKGSPIPNCPVMNRPDTCTREDGRFTLEHLSKDEDVTVRIDLPGYGPWSKTTQPDDRSFTLQVFPEGWQVLGNQAPPLFAAQWWNRQPVPLERARGKVVVLALGADPFAGSLHPPRPPFVSYAEPWMDIHRRFGKERVQIIIVLSSGLGYSMAFLRQDLEQAYLEVDDPSFAACVDENPRLFAPFQPEGNPSRGATYTLYQARRPNTVVLIDKQGMVRAYPQPQDLHDWVQRLVEE